MEGNLENKVSGVAAQQLTAGVQTLAMAVLYKPL